MLGVNIGLSIENGYRCKLYIGKEKKQDTGGDLALASLKQHVQVRENMFSCPLLSLDFQVVVA